MPNFESGVAGYVVGEYTIKVYFPVDLKGEADISCKQCPMYWQTSRRCGLNQAIVEYPEKFVGSRCPLQARKDEDEYVKQEND